MNLDPAVKKKLAAAKKLWAKAKDRAGEGDSFQEYDDGRYIMKLVGAEIGESQSSGRLQIDWTWKFLEGEYKGNFKHAYEGLETEDNLMWVGRTLVKLGAEMPDDFDDLSEVLVGLVKSKPVVRIKLTTKGDFQNLSVQRLIDEDEIEEEDDEDEETEETEEEDDEEDEEEDDEEEEEEEDDDDEEEEAAEEEESVEVESGTRVIAKVKGKNKVGVVVSVAKNGDSAIVRLDAGGDKVKVALEDLSVPEEKVQPKVKKQTGKAKK